MQIQISQQDVKIWVPYYANKIATLFLRIIEDFMLAKKSYRQNPSFSICNYCIR